MYYVQIGKLLNQDSARISESLFVEEWVVEDIGDVRALLLLVVETLFYEVFALLGDVCWLAGELHLGGFQDYALFENSHLRHLLAEGFLAE